MRVQTILKASAAAVGLVLALPAVAQSGGPVNTLGSDENIIVNDLLDLFLTDNAADSYSTSNSYSRTDTRTFTNTDTRLFRSDTTVSKDNGSYNGNSAVAANQSLSAVNVNKELDHVADFGGAGGPFPSTQTGYHSGQNGVSDNAFAAFAGINNLAFNSGLDATAQAATNIAAHGTVTFGSPN